MDFSPTLNPARASSPIDNDENKSQLEKATFLSLAAGILYHGFSRVPYARGTPAQNKREAGTSHSSAGRE
jgi:hypothetical protein